MRDGLMNLWAVLLEPTLLPRWALVADGAVTALLLLGWVCTIWRHQSLTREWTAFLRELDRASRGRIAQMIYPREGEPRRQLEALFEAVRTKDG